MRAVRRIFVAIVASSPLLLPAAWAMTVEEAYRAIPHRRTIFALEAAKMSQGERQHLSQLFQLVDQAIVERVQMLIWLQTGGRRGAPATRYDEILSHLKRMSVPARLANVHRLVEEAIEEQRAALEEWRSAGLPASLAAHVRVDRSSQKLRQAYGELMQLFPKEEAHNQNAFFDYLCALDFK